MQHIHLTFMGLLDPGGVVHLSWVGMIIVSSVRLFSCWKVILVKIIKRRDWERSRCKKGFFGAPPFGVLILTI